MQAIHPNTQTLLCKKAKSHVLLSNSIEELYTFNNKIYNVASYKRKPAINIDKLLNLITKNHNFNFFESAGKEKIRRNLLLYFKESGIQLNEELNYLISDIYLLITTFSSISNTKKVNLLLSVVNSDMCRLFHTDINNIRLLCTYKGAGTLWVENDNVNWENSGNNASDINLIKNPKEIHQTEPFEVLIMKGVLNESNNAEAVLHRSPTIEEIGENRLLLRIDTPDFGKY